MKRIFTIVIILLACVNLSAQNFPSVRGYSTVYTRNGTAVEGTLYYPLSSSDYSDALKYIRDYYPNVTIQENPTSEYNCYSYAFHLSEGNTQRVWINPYTTTNAPNLSNYWTDGSFIQVCNESDGDKALYVDGGHAAKTTSTITGQYESKWGANCRVIHLPTDVPYNNPTNRTYYASTKISGDASNLCTGTRTFSVKNISGAAYTWTYSSSLSTVSATNMNQLIVQRNGSSTGAAWIQVQISTPCSATPATSRIDFLVGLLPTLSVSSYVDRTPQYNDYQYVTATAEQLAGTVPGDYSWYEEANGIRGAFLAIGLQLSNYPIPPCATVYYQCVATTSCGEAVYRGYAYNTTCGGYAISSSLVAFPNPANTELNIHNTDEAGKKDGAPKDGSISDAANPEFQVRLYNEKGNILRSAKNPKGSKGVKLDITDVPNGTYYLHIAKGKEVLKKQIIISH